MLARVQQSIEREANKWSEAHLQKALLYEGSEAASDRGQMGCTALPYPC